MKAAEFWKDWTRCTGKLTWRLATPDDLPAIRRLRNVSERFLKQPQRNPSLFRVPVLLTLVAENERGKIADCVYFEAQVEIVKLACTPESLAESSQLQDDVALWLKSMGIETVLMKVLPEHKPQMAAGIEALGFKCMDRVFSYWRRLL